MSCPTCKDHTKDTPNRYVEWHAWAEEKCKTHTPVRCKECNNYTLWEKKKS